MIIRSTSPLPDHTIGYLEEQIVPLRLEGTKTYIGTCKVSVDGDHFVIESDVTDPKWIKKLSGDMGHYSVSLEPTPGANHGVDRYCVTDSAYSTPDTDISGQKFL